MVMDTMRRGRVGVLEIVFLALVLLFLRPVVSFAETLSPGEVLTLSRAVELALKNQPAIAGQSSRVRASEAKTDQARSNWYPQVNAGAGYGRTKAVTGGRGVALSPGSGGLGASTSSYEDYSSNVVLNQNVFDFGKTSSQVKIQDLNTQSSRFNLENTRDDVVFNVKQAFFGFLQAQASRDVAKESLEQFQRQLDRARAFFDVGLRPKFDVTKAEVDVGNAQLVLIRGENQVKLSRVNLNNAMGLPDVPQYTIADDKRPVGEVVKLDDALQQAFAQRPDLLAVIRQKEASAESIKLAQKNYLPNVTGNASYSWYGTSFPLGDGWNLGLNLSIPIFEGFLTKYQVAEAQANRDTAAATERSLRQEIFLQVEQGYLAFKEAEERIVTAELTARQAKENYDLAQGRYQAGVGSPIEVSDALVAYRNAEITYVNALYDQKIAQAQIQRVTGLR
jgi:outer membrane protein